MPMATWPDPHRMLLTSLLGRLKTDPRVLAVHRLVTQTGSLVG